MNAEEMDQKVSKYSDCWNVCVSAPFTHNPLVSICFVGLWLWRWPFQPSQDKIRTCNIRQCYFSALSYTHTLTGHFIRYTLLVPGRTPFTFRTALILRDTDSTRCWKHSSEILVHIDMIASHSCCRFVGYTSMMWISVPPHPKGALLTVDAIWVKWTHCHVQETSLRWFELCDSVLSCWK